MALTRLYTFEFVVPVDQESTVEKFEFRAGTFQSAHRIAAKHAAEVGATKWSIVSAETLCQQCKKVPALFSSPNHLCHNCGGRNGKPA